MAVAYINVHVDILAEFRVILPRGAKVVGSAESSQHNPGYVSFVLDGPELEADALYTVEITDEPLCRTAKLVKIGEVS